MNPLLLMALGWVLGNLLLVVAGVGGVSWMMRRTPAEAGVKPHPDAVETVTIGRKDGTPCGSFTAPPRKRIDCILVTLTAQGYGLLGREWTP